MNIYKFVSYIAFVSISIFILGGQVLSDLKSFEDCSNCPIEKTESCIECEEVEDTILKLSVFIYSENWMFFEENVELYFEKKYSSPDVFEHLRPPPFS